MGLDGVGITAYFELATDAADQHIFTANELGTAWDDVSGSCWYRRRPPPLTGVSGTLSAVDAVSVVLMIQQRIRAAFASKTGTEQERPETGDLEAQALAGLSAPL